MKSLIIDKKVYWTEHEFGGQNRVRLWTDTDIPYGAFQIISREEFEEVKSYCEKAGFELIYQDDIDEQDKA